MGGPCLQQVVTQLIPRNGTLLPPAAHRAHGWNTQSHGHGCLSQAHRLLPCSNFAPNTFSFATYIVTHHLLGDDILNDISYMMAHLLQILQCFQHFNNALY